MPFAARFSFLAQATAPVDLRDLRPLTGLEEPPFQWTLQPFVLVILAAAIVMALTRVITRLARWPPRTAHTSPAVWACRELDALRLQIEGPTLGPREAWFRTSAIVREFVMRQWRLAAPGRTTEELLGSLQDGPSRAEVEALSTLLRRTDQVKYAGLTPTRTETLALLDETKALVAMLASAPRLPGS